ncbi:MAG TPA: hypothetical protein VJ577_17095 [Burkholderiaceae bacterium]|nr:hypothetical protein [Burkholderiaceae bacterium]
MKTHPWDGYTILSRSTGLRVKAVLKRGSNEIGERVSDHEMRRLRIQPHVICPAWNYTLRPRADQAINSQVII